MFLSHALPMLLSQCMSAGSTLATWFTRPLSKNCWGSSLDACLQALLWPPGSQSPSASTAGTHHLMHFCRFYSGHLVHNPPSARSAVAHALMHFCRLYSGHLIHSPPQQQTQARQRAAAACSGKRQTRAERQREGLSSLSLCSNPGADGGQ